MKFVESITNDPVLKSKEELFNKLKESSSTDICPGISFVNCGSLNNKFS
mgnify:CR=1 FL=1